MKKEHAIAAFDKATGYGDEYGGLAYYNEINPIREEFISLLNSIEKIECRAFISSVSQDALRLLDDAIAKGGKL